MKWFFWVFLVNIVVFLLIIVGFLSNIFIVNIPMSVKSPNYSIAFSPAVLASLNSDFSSGVEHKVCLDGVFVSYHNMSFNRIVSDVSGLHDSLYGDVYCSSVGSLHNHVKDGVFGVCSPSIADINGWKKEASLGTTFFIIQCDVNKFIFYTSEDLYNGVVYDAK